MIPGSHLLVRFWFVSFKIQSTQFDLSLLIVYSAKRNRPLNGISVPMETQCAFLPRSPCLAVSAYDKNAGSYVPLFLNCPSLGLVNECSDNSHNRTFYSELYQFKSFVCKILHI